MARITVTSPSGALEAIVDDEDFTLLEPYAWHMAGGKGRVGKYAATHVTIYGKPTTHYMHRMVAWAMDLIPSPIGGGRAVPSVDHINGNKLDNRRANLRLRDRSAQMLNTNDALRSTNTSGHRGVSCARPGRPKPWMAYVQVHGKSKNLGWYATAEEAADARRHFDEVSGHA